MNTYVILAGGYWGLSRKPDFGGFQVDENDPDNRRTVDYVVKINGLPDDTFQPVEVRRRYKYFCKRCNRYIPQFEQEQNIGCWKDHANDRDTQWYDQPIWETGLCDAYTPEKQKWLKPCHRIFLNNAKGIQKWREIWRLIDRTVGTKVRLIPDLLPKAVGTIIAWDITAEDVPVIDLTLKAMPKAQSESESEFVSTKYCDLCKKDIDAKKYRQHMWGKHKMKTNKSLPPNSKE